MPKRESDMPIIPDQDEPIEQPDPMDVLARLTAALERMSAAPKTAQNDELSLKLANALERLGELQLEGSKLIASETRRAHRPSNEITPGVSVFNRRGAQYPEWKPRLKCDMFIPWIVEWECCTREEVMLLNLLEPGEYKMRRTDGVIVPINIKVEYRADNNKPSRLLLHHDTAFKNENFRQVPPLVDFLRYILNQHQAPIKAMARAVITDDEEMALIESGELTVSV